VLNVKNMVAKTTYLSPKMSFIACTIIGSVCCILAFFLIINLIEKAQNLPITVAGVFIVGQLFYIGFILLFGIIFIYAGLVNFIAWQNQRKYYKKYKN